MREPGRAAARGTGSVPPPDPQLTRIVSWFFILAAIPLAIFTATRSYDKLTADTWPSAQAEVLASDSYRRRGQGGTDWCVKLHYTYAVDGKAFSSHRLSTSRIGGGRSCDRDRTRIDARLEQLQPGAPITIRYRPSDPATAIVYVDELDILDYLFPVIVLVLFAGGIGALRKAAAMERR